MERILYFRMNTNKTIINTIRLCEILLWTTSTPNKLNRMSMSGTIDKNKTREILRFGTGYRFIIK